MSLQTKFQADFMDGGSYKRQGCVFGWGWLRRDVPSTTTTAVTYEYVCPSCFGENRVGIPSEGVCYLATHPCAVNRLSLGC